MDKFVKAYYSGRMHKNADLSTIASGAGEFAKQIPGMLWHAVKDPAVGMVRDNFRANRGMLDTYVNLIKGDMGAARNSYLNSVVKPAGSALGNTALTGLNLLGGLVSIPEAGAPEAALLTAETAARGAIQKGGLQAIREFISRNASSLKQPITNAIRSGVNTASKAIGPTASDAIGGAGQFAKGLFGTAYWNPSRAASGISNLGNIIQGVSRSVGQPVANVVERLGVNDARNTYSNFVSNLINRSSLRYPSTMPKWPVAVAPVLGISGEIGYSGVKTYQHALNQRLYRNALILQLYNNSLPRELDSSGKYVIPTALGIGGGLAAYKLLNRSNDSNKKEPVIN